ncbi:hypothetical protein PGB90_001789 [Kerria lacca]
MRKMYKMIVIVFVFFTISAYAAPWLDLFLNSFPQNTWSESGHRNVKSGKERYKQLCRVLNPDNYAFPEKIPYPAAPICPY